MRGARVIGFTGTIASGKTARCRRLVQTALMRQLNDSAADKTTPALSAADALVLATSYGAAPPPLAPAVAAAAFALPVGVAYIGADRVGHDIYAPGKPCYDEVLAHFGERVLQRGSATPSGGAGTIIDRRALGAIVFADAAQLAALNTICWPHIERAIRARVRAAQQEAASVRHQRGVLIVLEAALLLEMGSALTGLCTDVWLTHCDSGTAVARVQRRDGLSEEEARSRVGSQSNYAEKRATLARMGFASAAGTLVDFDTSTTTLDEGLRAVDDAYAAYWERHLRRLLD